MGFTTYETHLLRSARMKCVPENTSVQNFFKMFRGDVVT
jgi:hypothetical protein